MAGPRVISPGGSSEDHVARGGGYAIDIPGTGGETLLPLHDGVVTFAGWSDAHCGWAVQWEWQEAGVHHLARYCHLAERPWVAAGAQVQGGNTPLGMLGASGESTGPHVHALLERSGYRLRLEDIFAGQPPPGPGVPSPRFFRVDDRDWDNGLAVLNGWVSRLESGTRITRTFRRNMIRELRDVHTSLLGIELA